MVYLVEIGVVKMQLLDRSKWIDRKHTFATDIINSFVSPSEEKEEQEPEVCQPEGMVVGFTGRRRRGKSLTMVTLAYLFLRYYGYPILANFKCKYATGLPKANTAGLKSGLFTLEEIIQFPPELEDCVLIWDEIDRIFISKRSNTLLSEFLENGLNMLGKRNIWLLWGAQNIRRINGSLFWQTDFLWECDSRNKGQSVPITMRDLHGAVAEPGAEAFRVLTDSWRHKTSYNTKEMFDPTERLSVIIDRQKIREGAADEK